MAEKKKATKKKKINTDPDASAPAGKEWYDDGGNEGLVLRDIPDEPEEDEEEDDEDEE